jgi:hypothetical protein
MKEQARVLDLRRVGADALPPRALSRELGVRVEVVILVALGLARNRSSLAGGVHVAERICASLLAISRLVHRHATGGRLVGRVLDAGHVTSPQVGVLVHEAEGVRLVFVRAVLERHRDLVPERIERVGAALVPRGVVSGPGLPGGPAAHDGVALASLDQRRRAIADRVAQRLQRVQPPPRRRRGRGYHTDRHQRHARRPLPAQLGEPPLQRRQRNPPPLRRRSLTARSRSSSGPASGCAWRPARISTTWRRSRSAWGDR